LVWGWFEIGLIGDRNNAIFLKTHGESSCFLASVGFMGLICFLEVVVFSLFLRVLVVVRKVVVEPWAIARSNP
jgi:hypothetical protein